MPKYIGEILSFIILAILVILMISGGEIWYEISTINSYRSNVVKMAQRSSGFNQPLKDEMNTLGKDYYGERMQVQPMTTNGNTADENDWKYTNVNYGHDIGFYIQPEISQFNAFFLKATDHKDVNRTFELPIYVVSQARNNSFGVPNYSQSQHVNGIE